MATVSANPRTYLSPKPPMQKKRFPFTSTRAKGLDVQIVVFDRSAFGNDAPPSVLTLKLPAKGELSDYQNRVVRMQFALVISNNLRTVEGFRKLRDPFEV